LNRQKAHALNVSSSSYASFNISKISVSFLNFNKNFQLILSPKYLSPTFLTSFPNTA
jgi:hypothetical protein